jgi:hypothetical protein
VPLPVSRMIPVHVIYTGDDTAVKGFKILASRFASDQEAVPVEILMNCEANARVENKPAAFQLDDARTASVCLRLPELRSDGKYSGSLILFPDNKKPETQKKFTLSRAATSSATLATDRQTVTVELERPASAPFLTRRAFNSFLASVALREKSGKGQARGVAVETDSTLKAPGAFDPLTGLAFKWKGEAWDKPFSTPPAVAAGGEKPRDISADHQVEVGVTGENLQPGEYTIPLHFTAPGTNTDNAKISITVHVRDSILLAIAALLVALFLSLVITKVLTGKRRRIALLQQIRELRVSKGTTLPRLPAVVWVEAVLHLAERLSSRFWLSGGDIIDAHVKSVSSTAEILKQVRELRASLQLRLHQLVFDRAAVSIDRVVSELGTEPPDDAMAGRINTEHSTTGFRPGRSQPRSGTQSNQLCRSCNETSTQVLCRTTPKM